MRSLVWFAIKGLDTPEAQRGTKILTFEVEVYIYRCNAYSTRVAVVNWMQGKLIGFVQYPSIIAS
jgi:hypothetical protein